MEDHNGPVEVFAMTDDASEEFEGRPLMGRRVGPQSVDGTPRSHFNDSLGEDAFDRHSQTTISALEPLGDDAASSDTETIGGISDVSIGGGPISEAEPVPVVEEVSMGPHFGTHCGGSFSSCSLVCCCFRRPRGGLIPKQQLQNRQLLLQSEECVAMASKAFQRKRRTQTDTPERRADRAQFFGYDG